MIRYAATDPKKYWVNSRTISGLNRIIGMILILALSITGCNEANTRQEPPSWETQLRFAQKKARAVDPDVVLERAMTYRLPFKPPPDAPSYDIHFRFLNEAGTIVDVSFVNTQMTETVSVREANRTQSLPSKAEQERHEQIVSTIRIGPEEAIELTRAEGEAFATEHDHVSVQLGLFISSSDEEQQTQGAAAAWLVLYAEPLRGPDEKQATRTILVDAQTGAIID